MAPFLLEPLLICVFLFDLLGSDGVVAVALLTIALPNFSKPILCRNLLLLLFCPLTDILSVVLVLPVCPLEYAKENRHSLSSLPPFSLSLSSLLLSSILLLSSFLSYLTAGGSFPTRRPWGGLGLRLPLPPALERTATANLHPPSIAP